MSLAIEPEFLDCEILDCGLLPLHFVISEHIQVMLEGTLKKRDVGAVDQHVGPQLQKSGLLLQIAPKVNASTYL